MREAREHIGPGTWHAYGHALAARSARGGWPSAETLLEVAQGEGADPWALLTLTRGELPGLTPDRPREPTGRIEGIFARDRYWTRPTVLVPTCEALWAVVLSDDMLYARLVTPWDRRLDPRQLLSFAREWSTTSDTRAPHSIRLEEGKCGLNALSTRRGGPAGGLSSRRMPLDSDGVGGSPAAGGVESAA